MKDKITNTIWLGVWIFLAVISLSSFFVAYSLPNDVFAYELAVGNISYIVLISAVIGGAFVFAVMLIIEGIVEIRKEKKK